LEQTQTFLAPNLLEVFELMTWIPIVRCVGCHIDHIGSIVTAGLLTGIRTKVPSEEGFGLNITRDWAGRR
ncbi:MAG TPA: hypothetical protein VN203_12350, partial [Candidatus Acidoferrum sp.]|nr:hypothetical protein [Candidatus Acidoferrum sp.]